MILQLKKDLSFQVDEEKIEQLVSYELEFSRLDVYLNEFDLQRRKLESLQK